MFPEASEAAAEIEAQLGSMKVTRIEDPPEGAEEAAVVGIVADR